MRKAINEPRRAAEKIWSAFAGILPSFAESHGCKPVDEGKVFLSVALAKEGTLRRVSPYEACGEVPRP
jgi:hypothetical protein